MPWRLLTCATWMAFGAIGCGRDTPHSAARPSQPLQSRADVATNDVNEQPSTSTAAISDQTPNDAPVVSPPQDTSVKQPLTSIPAATASANAAQSKPHVDPLKPEVVTLVTLPVEDLIADTAFPVIALSDEAKQEGMVETAQPCVSIRGLFPNMRQLAQLIYSLNPRHYGTIPPQIWNFELERQEVVGKNAEWENVRWAIVDVKTALPILQHTAEFATEPLPHVVENVITMPLPQQNNGEWGKAAFHPRLTTQGFEQREKILRLAKPDAVSVELDEIVKQLYTEKENWLKTRFGDDFDSQLRRQRGFNRHASLHMLEADVRARRFMTPTEKPFKPGEPPNGPHLMIKAEHLLFRFFDFSVKPGNSYRYRVRLDLVNPFHQSRISVEPPDRFLKTPWSAPTKQVFVSDR